MATRTMRDLAQDLEVVLDALPTSQEYGDPGALEAADRLRADIEPYLDDMPGPDPLLVIRRVEERRTQALDMAERAVNEGRNFTASGFRAEAGILYSILTGEKEVGN